MARKKGKQAVRRAARPRAPRLPVTKKVVTTTSRVQFGNVDVDTLLDQAFVAADDGDCSRVAKTLDRAEAAGGNVGLHRKQLLQDCKLDRGGIPMSGVRDDVKRAVGGQAEWFNWRTAVVAVAGIWLGTKLT